MAKPSYPPEFASEWHYERHLEDLERELLGRERRLAELQALKTHPEDLAQAEAEVEAVREQLALYGVGQKKASTRPRKPKESR